MEYKAKVEKIETTGRGGKSIVFSGGFNGNALFTGKGPDNTVIPFPEAEVQVGKEVEFVIDVVKSRSGGEWNALSFPKYETKDSPPQATTKSSWQGGRQEDVELKLVSFAMSYAKDLFAATPEAKLEEMFTTADAIFEHMRQMYITAKG